MPTLLLRIAAPMQSWGVQSRFSDRDTGRFPSKSGLIGLLCAALGRDRAEPIEDLAALRLSIRIDRPGVLGSDFQTAGGGLLTGRAYGVPKANRSKGETVISTRHYLADAEFLVALEGEDALLNACAVALAQPAWPLFLGRKAFPPEWPLCLGVREEAAEDLLRSFPWRVRNRRESKPAQLQWVLEGTPDDGIARPDTPHSFAHDARTFELRHLRVCWKDAPAETIYTLEELCPCTSHASS